jgi:hypothetical protein
MNIFLFRLSRLLSVGMFIIVIGLSIIMIDRTSSLYSEFHSEGIFRILLINIGFLLLIFIFNWLCFQKLTIWIKKPSKENEE